MSPLGSGVASYTVSYPPAALYTVPGTQRVLKSLVIISPYGVSFTGLAVMTLICHQRAASCSSPFTSDLQTRASLFKTNLTLPKCTVSHASGFTGVFVGGEQVNLSLGRTYTPSQPHHSTLPCFPCMLTPEGCTGDREA